MIVGRDLPQHFPLPAIEPDRRNQAEPQQHPITSLLTAVSKPPMSPVGYNSQLEYADPAITTRKHEDDQRLDLFGTTEAPSAFSPTEGRAQSVNDLDVSVMMTKFYSQVAISPSNPIALLISARSPPCSPVFVDSMVKPPLLMYSYPLSVADSYEIGTNPSKSSP
ncbi:hypothetical protein DFH94DRAFT_197069 [Russula ochroleuca]|uniref:Uncharacterized protein n=1 Tax=Russula ochroleuca TaxID=152965 RepID=A0A9P5JYA7_9AGAM|nr:hypothetical protein DFH94DRAFT_197069 [Russula ochroleuca]